MALVTSTTFLLMDWKSRINLSCCAFEPPAARNCLKRCIVSSRKFRLCSCASCLHVRTN
eukprot:COSAG06_NODE_66888_length_253_cov_0.675325_1_plen_58_part_10